MSPRVIFPAVSSGLILAIFLIYYFPIVSRQQASLNERALRNLSAVSDQLQNRVLTYANVLEQVSKRELKPEERADAQSAFKRYLAEQVPDLALTSDIPKGSPPPKPCDPGKAATGLALIGGQSFFEFSCDPWKAQLQIERLVKPYFAGMPERLFDEVLVANAGGTVLYQTRRTSNRITQLPTTFVAPGTLMPGDPQAKPGSASPSFAVSSQISDLVLLPIAGT